MVSGMFASVVPRQSTKDAMLMLQGTLQLCQCLASSNSSQMHVPFIVQCDGEEHVLTHANGTTSTVSCSIILVIEWDVTEHEE